MYRRNGSTISFKDYVGKLDELAKERERWFKSWLEKFDLDRKDANERLERERKDANERLERERKAMEERLTAERRASEERLAADRMIFDQKFQEERKEARLLRTQMTFTSIGVGISMVGIFVAIILSLAQ